jgi:hypothetical protein
MREPMISPPDFDLNGAPKDEVKKPKVDEKTKKLLDLLQQSIINPTDEIIAPQICLWVRGKTGDSIIGTLGNFSLFIGKAKSRKTFLVTAALAATTRNGSALAFLGFLPNDKNTVLYFDTEQGRYHVYKTIKRICSLSGIDVPTNFTGYGLRKYPPAIRLAMIEAAIYNTPHLGFIVIDGIRDLINSINDEAEATMIISHLLRWSEEQNIHIVVVLHQNKNDKNARGHLGTELQNKAETVLSITKDEKNKEISIVEAEYCRDKDPDSFAFEIQSDGLPHLVADWEVKTSRAGNPKRVTPDEIPMKTHFSILKEVFKMYPKPLASILYTNLKIQFKKLVNLDISYNKIVEFVTYYKTEGILIVNESKKTTDRFHILNKNLEGVDDSNNDMPF